MILGPDYIYKCPKCGNLLLNGSLMSGSSIAASIFSDGKIIGPFFEEFPDLTKCERCSAIFWLSKLKEKGSPVGRTSFGWENADRAKFLEIDDYFKALNKRMAENMQEEKFIRIQIWRAYNDRQRKGKTQFIDDKDEIKWSENCNKLITLLDQTDSNQSIMIAELKRNLGDFDGCIDIILKNDNDELNWIKEKLINECEQKNNSVIKLV